MLPKELPYPSALKAVLANDTGFYDTGEIVVRPCFEFRLIDAVTVYPAVCVPNANPELYPSACIEVTPGRGELWPSCVAYVNVGGWYDSQILGVSQPVLAPCP